MTSSLLPDDVVALARRVVAENIVGGRTVALAESCTGGLVASAITEIPGSSRIFDRSFVTYSNEAKQDMLGVSPDLIDTFGAVSVAVAWAMAVGTLRNSHADIAVAITGVAGPDGGTEQKPVGTVVFARIARDGQPDEVETELRTFGEDLDRSEVRRQATLVALELLLP
jgi:nicotinamide-nucleotide amidase